MSTTAKSVTLREITAQTVRAICDLRVAPEQAGFVAPNALSIAQAYFERETAWFRAIYADETPVGFVMLEDDVVNQEYFLWRLMIDARHQGQGFGRQAIRLLLDYVRTRPGAKELFTSCIRAEGGPGPFYEKLGFQYTGEIEDGEHMMRLSL